jgi:hypothetical protein
LCWPCADTSNCSVNEKTMPTIVISTKIEIPFVYCLETEITEFFGGITKVDVILFNLLSSCSTAIFLRCLVLTLINSFQMALGFCSIFQTLFDVSSLVTCSSSLDSKSRVL